jgi:hypothetical protein
MPFFPGDQAPGKENSGKGTLMRKRPLAGASRLGRMSIERPFLGELEATGEREMLTAGSGVNGSAGYPAMERVSGTLQGRCGTLSAMPGTP